MMNQTGRTLLIGLVATLIVVVPIHGQGQRGGRGGAPQGGALPGAAAGARGAAPAPAPPKPLIANAKPVRSCESLASVALTDTTIESAVIDPNNPGICRVTAVTTHPPIGDKVRIWIGLPTSNWNGRFLGNGGGGFSGGNAASINQPVALGYASGATDTGHEGGNGSFALDASGRLNWQLIRDNAHVGIHEMTVTGKALTQAMYGVAPRYSYFNGCSTGGRQGLMEAQRYPQDYNGIMSGAPAINWTRFIPQELWGAVLMNALSKIQNAAATIRNRSSVLLREPAVPSRKRT
jgi:feruloyl esterase